MSLVPRLFAIVLSGLVCLGLGACGSSTNSGATASSVLFALDDHGSTNTAPWTLTIYGDGSGMLSTESDSRPAPRVYPEHTFALANLRATLLSLDVNNLPACDQGEQLPPVSVNGGSASFGSYASLEYEGRTIDRFCNGNHVERTLHSQLAAIVSTADL